MSKWISNINRFGSEYTETRYCDVAGLTKSGLNDMVNGFDTIFNNLTNFTDEIASIYLMPVVVDAEWVNDFQESLFLSTARGVTGIHAARVGLPQGRDSLGNRDYNSHSSRYLSMGECYVYNQFEDYKDFAGYNGYTQIKAYIPFVGFVDINVDEVIGKWLQFRLAVDYISGTGVVIVGVSDNSIRHSAPGFPTTLEDSDIRVLSTYKVQIGIEIPLGSSNISNIKRNIIMSGVKAVATLGVSAYMNSLPPPTTTVTRSTTREVKSRGEAKGARLKTAWKETVDDSETRTYNRSSGAGRTLSEIFDGSISALNSNYGGSSTDRIDDPSLGYIASREVKVLFYTPIVTDIGGGYNHLFGRPLGKIRKLKDVHGYTEISSIHIEDFGNLTPYILGDEMSMLENLITSGIILP